MKRQIILKANREVIASGGSISPGSSPYPWTNTPSKTLAAVWNTDPSAIVSDTHGVHWPGHSPAALAVGIEKPPTLVTLKKLILTTGFDYQQARGNGWYFPPDNAHGPAAALYFRRRDQVSWVTGTGTAAHTMAAGEPYYVNPYTEPLIYRLYTLTWELTSHPDGGPFTYSDLLNGGFGVVFSTSNGPSGQPVDPTVGGFQKMRVPYLKIVADVEDLGGYTRNVGYMSALALRLFRRARNVIKTKVSADHSVARQGERVYLSHPRGPSVGGHGWGAKRLEARDALTMKRSYSPEAFVVSDEDLDMRPIACLGWAAYRVDGPFSPELPGLSLLDKGRGFVHTRAQDAWARRPGDGVIMRVPEGFPSLSPEGLAVSGGGDVSVCLNNWDLMQSGWSTVASSGDFTAAADLTVYHAEEQGYLSSCRLTYGAGLATGGRERSLGTFPRADGDRLHVRVILRNVSVPSPSTQCGEWYLKRSGGGLAAAEYWSESGRTWTTTPTYQSIPSYTPSAESVADGIPCDASGATSDPTYVVGVGRFSAAMGPVTLYAGIVDVQHTDDTVAGCRPSIVTLGSTITRVADLHTMEHVWGRELISHERGTVVCEVRPWWRAVDLPDGAIKPLMHAQHATDTHDALQFVAETGANVVRFERAISGEATFQLDCPVTTDLTRAHVLRAWCRWLGADSWTEYGPYSVEVGYLVTLASDGSVVSSGSVLGRLSSEVAVPYARDYVGIGCDATRQIDGHVRMWETRRSPLHALECLWKV